MSTITESQISTLRCITQKCPYYKYNSHAIILKKHRCTFNSSCGMQILRAPLNDSAKAPIFCPFITDKDRAIAKGTYLAKRIGQKEKKLKEAQHIVNTLPGEITELYKQLEKVLKEGKTELKGESTNEIINNS